MPNSSSGLSGRTTMPNSIPTLPRRQQGRTAPASSQQDEHDDYYPLPPHLAHSAKRRAASDGRRPARTVRVEYDHDSSSSRLQVGIAESNFPVAWLTIEKSSPPPSRPNAQRHPPRLDSEQSSIGPDPNETDAIVQRPSRVGPKSRSFFKVPDQYKDLTARAAAHVRHYTFFENPMLNADEVAQLVTESWAQAQKEGGQALECIKVVDAHVSDKPYTSRRTTG